MSSRALAHIDVVRCRRRCRRRRANPTSLRTARPRRCLRELLHCWAAQPHGAAELGMHLASALLCPLDLASASPACRRPVRTPPTAGVATGRKNNAAHLMPVPLCLFLVESGQTQAPRGSLGCPQAVLSLLNDSRCWVVQAVSAARGGSARVSCHVLFQQSCSQSRSSCALCTAADRHDSVQHLQVKPGPHPST